MGFNAPLPEWKNSGQEPPSTVKDQGWGALNRPPAEWLNWFFNRTYKSLEELQQNGVSVDEFQKVNTNNLNGEIVEADAFEYNGANMTSIVPGQYQSTRATDLLNYVQQISMDSVAIVVTWFQDTKTSTVIQRDATKTVPDEDVLAIIRQAKGKGLKVMLKPHVDCNDGTWRGEINPVDTTAWFASYQQFILHYAQIAQNENVELFCIGTELKNMTKVIYQSNWTNVIQSIRSAYQNKLTYAATAMSSKDQEEYLVVPFWGLLDYAGLDVYFKLTLPDITPSTSTVGAAWTKSSEGQDYIRKLTTWQKVHGKPVLFTEIGCTVFKGSTQDPANYNISSTVDYNEQALYVDAIFRIWTSQVSWLKGFFWWRLAFSTTDAFRFENLPSAQVFADWIGHTKGGDLNGGLQ
ncbi:hypothetical protein LAV82_17745 [Bacillus sp. ILBB4]|nr:hypothetical protein [Bacillus sp. ILBB4]